jgi:hypothetical protein
MNLAGGMGTRALDTHDFARRRPQKTFVNMAAAGVAGAKNENSGFHGVF